VLPRGQIQCFCPVSGKRDPFPKNKKPDRINPTPPRSGRGGVGSDRHGLYRGFTTGVIQHRPAD
jgi:hypothetical protein